MVFPEFFFCASLAVRRSVRSTILQYHASSVPMHIWKKPRSDMEQPLHPLPCCFHRSCGYSEWRNKVLRHVSIICQKLLSILRQAVSAMDGNNNSFPKHLRQPCKERRSFLHGYAPHRIFQMHYKVLRKRKSLPLQVHAVQWSEQTSDGFPRTPFYQHRHILHHSHDGLLCCNRSRHSHSVPFGCRAL